MKFKKSERGFIRLIALFLFALLTIGVASGCGPDDPCADKTCDFGTCESSSGTCVNKSTCYVDDDCVPGYECGPDRQCVGQTQCSEDADCDAGVCNDDGICVNPSSGCEQNSDCVSRTFCNAEGQCVPDPCNDVTCKRGVCKRGTDNCVSKDSCSESTENLDCISGEKCADGTCKPAATFCEAFSCQRGVCAFEADGCRNAMDCQGERSRCLEGYFCDQMNTCRPDLCERNDVQCDRGVCVPSVGQCQNPTSCEDDGECLSGHVCIDGTCRLESVACGDAGGEGGCPGNQTCNFNDGTCSEPEVCETSFDCKSGRQCAGLTCLGSTMCKPDQFEPSDTAQNTIDLSSVAETSGQLSGTLCQGDVDRLSFDTTDFLAGSSTGTLIVTVDVPRRDSGLGAYEVAILKDGTEVTTARSGAMGRQHTVQADTTIGLTDHGSYVAEVRALDDMEPAGVSYDLSVNVVPGDVQSACNQATELRANQSISGTTDGAPSSNIGSSCTSPSNSSRERIYRIDLEAPQQMTFELTPQLSDANLSMSLRGECTQPSSEQSCADNSRAGEDETLTALLNRGTHYLIVQPTVDGSGGPFELTTETTFKACTGQDNFCSAADVAEICSAEGGRFRSIQCDAGCNPSSGECFPPAGDICGTAPSISPQDMSSGSPIIREINFPQLNNEYEIAPDGCLGNRSDRTTGPDKAYEVTLPPNKGVTAEVTFANEVQGALYVADTCDDVSGTCQKGAAGSTDEDIRETITFSNRTDSEVTRTLVVDTEAGQLLGTAQLSLEFKDVICTPGMKQCAGDRVETCNAPGTAYDTTDRCGYSCSQAVCQGEICSNAITIPNDGTEHTYSLQMGDFTNDYDIGGASCMEFGFDDSPGHEAVFSFQANAGDIVELSWAPSEEPSLYVVSDCSDVGGSCVAGIEDYGSTSVSQTFAVNQAGTYYVMADVDNAASGIYGTATLTAKIQQPTCTPKTGSCTSGGDFSYCTPLGLGTTYSCSNCCSSLGSGSSAPSTPIPDNDSAGITDSLTVSGCNGTTSKLYVGVNVTHSFVGDLVIDLTGPTGTTVNLRDTSGGGSTNIEGLYPETLTPNEALSPFIGANPNGNWTLNVADTASFDTGTLQDWQIHAACN